MYILLTIGAVITAPLMLWFYFYLNGTEVPRLGTIEFSEFLSDKGKRPKYDSAFLRGEFQQMKTIHQGPARGHTHGASAANRSAASAMIDHFLTTYGFKPLFYQCSKSDLRKGRQGYRTYHWVKDTSVPPQVTETYDGMVLIDVDYYVDMHQFLTKHFMPVMLYSFQPTQVAAVRENYSYTFNEDNTVTYKVTGGAIYKHKVWNYSMDNMIIKWVDEPYNCWSKGEYVVSTYLIDRRRMDDDHEIILLTPLKQYHGKEVFKYAAQLLGSELKPLTVVQGGFTRMSCVGVEHMMSTGRVGSYNSVTIPITIDEAIQNIATVTKKLNNYQVVGQLRDTQYEGNVGSAALLLDYHRQLLGVSSTSSVFPLEDNIVHYQVLDAPSDFVEDAKPVLEQFMDPIIPGVFVPNKTRGNEKACADGRVVNIKSNPVLTPFKSSLMKSFVNLICQPVKHWGTPMPGVNSGCYLIPCDYDTVLEQQKRPSQLRDFNDSSFTQENGKLPTKAGFIKAEGYTAPKDPRPIVTFQGVEKFPFGRFVIPLMKYMYQFDWYAFSRSEEEIAHKVADVCSKAKQGAIMTDFSRFDGRVNKILRDLMMMIMFRLYETKYHKEIHTLLTSQYNCSVRMPEGHRYKSEYSLLSGSWITSVFGTVSNKFIQFVASRMTKRGDDFIQDVEAFNWPSVLGGDDGLTIDIDPKVYEKAASSFGLKLTGEMIPIGDIGVNFLSRFYGPNVWYGDPNSMADLYRQLSKFHTTVTLQGVTELQKLKEKVRAFYRTDKNTPILGEFISKAKELTDDIDQVDEHRLRPIKRWTLQGNAYPNEVDDWGEFYVRKLVECGFDPDTFRAWLSSVSTAQEILSPPQMNNSSILLKQEPIKGKILVLNGTYHSGPTTKGKQKKPNNSGKKPHPPKRGKKT